MLKTPQIRAVQLKMNNVSDSQDLGDLLNQILLDEQIDLVYIDRAYDTKRCRQVIVERQGMQCFSLEKMRDLGKIQKFILGNEMNYFEQLHV